MICCRAPPAIRRALARPQLQGARGVETPVGATAETVRRPSLDLEQIVHRLRIGFAAGRPSSPDRRTSRSFCGLARACADLVRDWRRRCRRPPFRSHPFGDLLHAARLDERTWVAAFGPDDLEQVLGDLAGDGALADQIDNRGELDADTGDVAMSRLSLFRRPNSSLITQLAASLPSRPALQARPAPPRRSLRSHARRPARPRHTASGRNHR